MVRRMFSKLAGASLPALPASWSSRSLIDLLGEPLVYRSKGLVDVLDATVGNFLEVLGDQRCGREPQRLLLLVGADPRLLEERREQRPVGGCERLQVKVRSPAGERRGTRRRHLHELEALAQNLAVTGLDRS